MPLRRQKKAWRYSPIIESTAEFIDPSGPRSASPGPSIASSVVWITAWRNQPKPATEKEM